MPVNQFGAGRLVPASVLDFSRSAKNLAWLFECPLHDAQELLAQCYGFGSAHELRAAIPEPGDNSRETGPFDAPRARPPYFPVTAPQNDDPADNRVVPLSARERQLMNLTLDLYYSRTDEDGRIRRRHYAVLDGAFFSVPSVHRKHFAALKAGILAMEGSEDTRERYLEQHWPPAFWAYLEVEHQQPMDASAGLSELKDRSSYFSAQYVMSIADLFHATAAHRAPAIFLEMAGEATEPLDDILQLPEQEYVYDGDLPSIAAHRTGLFEPDEDAWVETVSNFLAHWPDAQLEAVCELTPEAMASSPPEGVPDELVDIARKWRLHHLREMATQYCTTEYTPHYLAREHSFSHLAASQEDDYFSKNWLSLYAEFEDRKPFELENEARHIVEFKVLLTYDQPNEPKDVVGYMAGWLVCMASDKYVCDDSSLIEDASYISSMLEDGLHGFLQGYCSFHGYDDLLAYINSRYPHAVAITEIVLRDKYANQGLMEDAIRGFAEMQELGSYSDYPSLWREYANFDEPVTDSEQEYDMELLPPSVFMMPVHRQDKQLRQSLMKVSPIDHYVAGLEGLDVFPFHIND